MDDIKIIDLFFARSELAIEALDGKYGAICHNLSRSILKDQQDAEECVNDAYTDAGWRFDAFTTPNQADMQLIGEWDGVEETDFYLPNN